jgi:hypothetical protein
MDQEMADLVAAKTVRDALNACISRDSWTPFFSETEKVPVQFLSCERTVQDTIAMLLADGRIDDKTASYVLDHVNRFTLCSPPHFFDAQWHLKATES